MEGPFILIFCELCSLRSVCCFCNKWSSFQGPSQGLLLPTGSLWGAAQNCISASVSAPFFPSGLSIHMRQKASPQEEAALLSQQSVLGGQTQLQEPHTAWGSWQWEGNEPILVFKGNVLLCYRRKEVWVINSFFNHQQLLSVTLCWTISAWHLSTPPWCLLVRLPHLLSHQHPPQPSLLAWYS